MLTWTGSRNPPQGILVGPLKVTSAGHAASTACNLTDSRVIAQNVAVRIVALK